MVPDAADHRPLPATFRAILIVGLAYATFTAYDQSYWWRTKEDYSFGWLVPVFTAYVIHQRWPAIRRQVTDPGHGQPGAAGTGWNVLQAAAPWLFLIAQAIFLFGAFFRGVAGTTHLSSLAITAGATGVILMGIYLVAPIRAASAAEASRQRWGVTALFLFPASVWLISAPLLSSVENGLALTLMGQITTIVFFVFDRLGLALEQRGNILMLPTGSVGVEEACSGIRSLTGCLFAGTFLGAVFVRSWWRKVVFAIASLLFAFVANLLRSLFLTSWAYYHGAKSIEGNFHDATGYAVLGLAVIGLLLLLPILDRKPKPTPG